MVESYVHYSMQQTVPLIAIIFYGVIIRVGLGKASGSSTDSDMPENTGGNAGVLSTIMYINNQETQRTTATGNDDANEAGMTIALETSTGSVST